MTPTSRVQFTNPYVLTSNLLVFITLPMTGCMLNGRPVARGECISSRANVTPVTTSPAGEWSRYPIFTMMVNRYLCLQILLQMCKEKKQVFRVLFSAS